MKQIIKNNLGIVILISVVILILIISEVPRLKTAITPSPSPTAGANLPQIVPKSSFKEPSYSQPPTDANGNVNESSPQVQAAIAEKQKIEPQLPIYVENFQTTVGVATTLNVYTIPEDSDYLIHVEIYGINYGDSNLLQEGNINAQAFIESFNKIKEIMTRDGADIHNIYFIFGAKPYIQVAADNLIHKYNLL